MFFFFLIFVYVKHSLLHYSSFHFTKQNNIRTHIFIHITPLYNTVCIYPNVFNTSVILLTHKFKSFLAIYITNKHTLTQNPCVRKNAKRNFTYVKIVKFCGKLNKFSFSSSFLPPPYEILHNICVCVFVTGTR